jgi:hypothetical protein
MQLCILQPSTIRTWVPKGRYYATLYCISQYFPERHSGAATGEKIFPSKSKQSQKEQWTALIHLLIKLKKRQPKHPHEYQ